MKKLLVAFYGCLISVFIFCFAACGVDEGGTYYPDNSDMKVNLENNGYVVTLYQDLSDNDGYRHGGTLLYASRTREYGKEEYLYFYRFENVASCDYYFEAMEKDCENYNVLVKLENDKKFGNIVYCGTTDAVDAAGIKAVNVNLKV